MYEKLIKLNNTNLNTLLSLKSSVVFTRDEMRLGHNRTANLSEYSSSKWKDWTKLQRDQFKNCFDRQYVDNSIIGWFLNFPADVGFLDLMKTWENSNNCGTIVAYSFENQDIFLEGNQISLLAGEGIKFKLNVAHEIKKSSLDRNWACLMLMIS